jgi:acyl-coenzyme A thioesterase PaaI-like protein
MTRDASVPTPIGNGVGKRRGLPNPRVDAIMQATQGGMIVEKQPNSRMCFLCGTENPIGLHLRFYTDDEGRCIARFRPKPEHQGYPGQLHGGIISSLLDEPTQISILPRVLAV